MTVSFYKLQVAGDDFVLVDRSLSGHERLLADPGLLADLARSILDRRRGVGGRALIAVALPYRADSAGLSYRVYEADGLELYGNNDARLCVARWAFDSGRGIDGQVLLSESSGEIVLTALDSRSFSLCLPPPRRADGNAVLAQADGHLARVSVSSGVDAFSIYLIRLERPYAVVFPTDAKFRLRPIREAVKRSYPEAAFVAVRLGARDLVRFVSADSSDRLAAAAAAVAAAVMAKRGEAAAVAEWRGCGAAIAYAYFDKENPNVTAPLVDRGRFWMDWLPDGRLRAAGIAEYVFEGKFDCLEL